MRLNLCKTVEACDAATRMLSQLSADALQQLTELVRAFDRAWQGGYRLPNGVWEEEHYLGVLGDWCEEHGYERGTWDALISE